MTSPVSFGVVIPAYNAERYLERSLGSVARQTYAPARVMVVDDESQDGSAERALALGAEVLRRPHGGPARARNAGVAALETDWIAFLDADDAWRPQTLERFATAIGCCPDVRVVFGDYDVDEPRAPIASWFARDAAYASIARRPVSPGIVRCDRQMLVAALVRSLAFVSTSSLAVRRDAFVGIGGFDEGLIVAEDLDLLLRLFTQSTAAVVEEVLSTYHLHGDNLSKDAGVNAEWELRVLERVRERPDRYPAPAATLLTRERPVRLARAGTYALRGGRFGEARRCFALSWSAGASFAAAGGMTLAALCDNAIGRIGHRALRAAWRSTRTAPE
ncbi:MAG: glycosyltransferase like 2 family protein [Candidatus Eremiobacteraeota bacterium]|nr:glycosyltransferase like 2 family protein [Candidatus Eremiobacteraeota bacterium]